MGKNGSGKREENDESAKQRNKADRQACVRSGHCSELEWFLCVSAAALGERSNLAALVAAASHGTSGGPSGVPNTDPYSDAQIGWDLEDGEIGYVERERRCREAWRKLSAEDQETLAARYCLNYQGFPPGFRGQLAELAVLAWLLAAREGKLDEINSNADKQKGNWKHWRDEAVKASLAAHERWRDARGIVAAENAA